jgi:hypothetical protein
MIPILVFPILVLIFVCVLFREAGWQSALVITTPALVYILTVVPTITVIPVILFVQVIVIGHAYYQVNTQVGIITDFMAIIRLTIAMLHRMWRWSG